MQPILHLTLTPKQARELLALLKDEVDWGYGLSDDLEALRRELKERLRALEKSSQAQRVPLGAGSHK